MRKPALTTKLLADIDERDLPRLRTPIGEWDRVLGYVCPLAATVALDTAEPPGKHRAGVTITPREDWPSGDPPRWSQRLRRVRHLYWPCPSEEHPGSKRRYLDRKFSTPDGRALFLPRDHREPRELPDHEFPFVLTTGRLYSHWHTLTRTAKCGKLVRPLQLVAQGIVFPGAHVASFECQPQALLCPMQSKANVCRPVHLGPPRQAHDSTECAGWHDLCRTSPATERRLTV